MSDILRNNPTLEFGACVMREDPDGMWVTYPSHQQALANAKAEIEKLSKWVNGIEYHLGSGQISCEEVWSKDGEYIGIRLRQIEQQSIGSDTEGAKGIPDQPVVVICIHNIESAVVLLQLVTRICDILTNPKAKAAAKKAAVSAKLKEIKG